MATSINRAAPEAPLPSDGAGLTPRLLLLVGLAVLAVAMLRSSLALIVRSIDPMLAMRLAPENADVLESRSEQLIRLDPSPANRVLAETFARRALARSPVSAAGARMLATTRDMAGDSAGALRLMHYAEGLSRRDLPTELWFIEDAVRRNDIPEALRHYDLALRGTVATPPLLFPILIAATAQPAVVKGLTDTLAARPLWGDPFLLQAAHDSADLNGLAALMIGLARRGYRLPPSAIAQASGRIVDAGLYDLAWRLFRASHIGQARGMLRDPNFARLGQGDTPFDWVAIQANGVEAETRTYGANARLAYSAPTGSGGVAVRQLLLLPEGAYQLGGRSFNVAAGAQPAVLRLTCAGGGRPIAAISSSPGGPDGKGFDGRFSIPAQCPAQWLEIFAEGGDSPSGCAGEIDDLRILPVSQGT